MYKIAILGITGKMGSMVFSNLVKNPKYTVSGGVAMDNCGKKVSEVLGIGNSEAVIYSDIEDLNKNCEFDILIDFSRAEISFESLKKVSDKKVVSGTTGFNDSQIKELSDLFKSNGGSLLIAPNFSIGAVLMMELSAKAAKYFSGCEIIELHHTQKADSPSGTAKLTAKKIAENSEITPFAIENGTEFRGGDIDNIRIHSVRLPGFIAHQEVLFGNPGELFKIRHDSTNRNSFMNGILKGVEYVCNNNGFVYGLEKII